MTKTRTATQRVNDSIAALKQAGGARKSWRLSPTANEALKICLKLGDDVTETDLINRLLIDEKNRLL